jgi:ribonucleoside-triphosphate reductase
MNVIKRNGEFQEFSREKVFNAIKKAFESQEYDISDSAIQVMADDVHVWDDISIESIQDQIEEILMDYDYYDVAKAYILYRYQREILRKSNTTDQTILELIHGENEYWNKENANKRAYLSTTQHDYLAGISSTDIMRRLIFPKEITEAHDAGIIHVHDMDYRVLPMLNCCLINLKDMLENGTVINGYMIGRQKKFLTACTVATQIILQVSSYQYGGCTITTSHLAPFLRMSREYYQEEYPECWEKLFYKEIADGVQTFNYQINSMSNSNGQSPFLSVALYVNEDPEYAEENYLIIQEFLAQRIKGLQNEDGVWVTPAFPKLLYFLDEDTIKGGKYYNLTKLAAACSAKRLVPDYISVKKMKELKDGQVYPCIKFCA